MAEQRQRRSPRSWTGLFVLALAGTILVGTVDARAEDGVEKTMADLALKMDLAVDEQLEAFDDPVLVRAKARVAPPWRGPLGEPPFTERRNCPDAEIPDFITPPYC